MPGKPTGVEGTAIHRMIQQMDFWFWGQQNGRFVGYEVPIPGASKNASTLVSTGPSYLRAPIPDIDDPYPGSADLVDWTGGQVYDIKHLPTALAGIAMADAEWYRWHMVMNYPLSSNASVWMLGFEYLAGYPYGQTGKLIGDWPGYPDYEVRAVSVGPGAIGYYARKKNNRRSQQQFEFESSSEYAEYLAYLAALAALGKATLEVCKERLVTSPGNFIYIPEFLMCEMTYSCTYDS